MPCVRRRTNGSSAGGYVAKQRSKFVARLPVTHEAKQPQITPPHEMLSNTIVRRVLVVDDNCDAAESLALLLKLSDHDAHLVHDGLEAVQKAT